jgi:hypothetical protein
VYVASAVAAVGELWDRSGLLAGPVIGDQLARFGAALVDAHAAGECDPTFELAVDAVVHGRLSELTTLMAAHPDLPVRRSGYGHRATLLHYTAANGVEIRRQIVPANAADIVAALLDGGADRSATFHAYGGEFDVLVMPRTSAHPRDAGVAAAVEHALA